VRPETIVRLALQKLGINEEVLPPVLHQVQANRTPISVLEEPGAFEANRIQEEEATTRTEAERPSSGLTMSTDGSRLDSGAAGYAATWQNGQHWVGIETNMGYNQKGNDTECAALVRALETAAKRQTTPEMVQLLHRRPGGHQAHGIGGTWPQESDVHDPGAETHRGAKEGQTGHHHPDLVVPSAQRGPRD
jgi:hypothetical protein